MNDHISYMESFVLRRIDAHFRIYSFVDVAGSSWQVTRVSPLYGFKPVPTTLKGNIRKNKKSVQAHTHKFDLLHLTKSRPIRPDPSKRVKFPRHRHTKNPWLLGSFFSRIVTHTHPPPSPCRLRRRTRRCTHHSWTGMHIRTPCTLPLSTYRSIHLVRLFSPQPVYNRHRF